MSEQKAYLLINGDARKRIPCMFNPSELSLTLSNSWSGAGDGSTRKPEAVPGKGVPTLQFTGPQSGTMSLDLFFDTTHDGSDVTEHTSQVVALMDIDEELAGTDPAKRVGRPPTIQFGWGTMTSFPCVITSLTLRFTYFSSTGMPLRASMSLKLTQYREARSYGPQNPTSGTPLPHRVHRVQPGETLDRIAAKHLGDATKWRLLAAANAIEDPLDLRAGALLAVPRPES